MSKSVALSVQLRRQHGAYRGYGLLALAQGGGPDRRKGQKPCLVDQLPTRFPLICLVRVVDTTGWLLRLRIFGERHVARRRAPIRRREVAYAIDRERLKHFGAKSGNAGLLCTRKQGNSNQHRRSIASSFLNNDVGTGQNAVAEDLFGSRAKIRELNRTPPFLLCRNDAGDDFIAIAKLDGLSCAQPSFELAGISKLSDVYVRHR